MQLQLDATSVAPRATSAASSAVLIDIDIAKPQQNRHKSGATGVSRNFPWSTLGAKGRERMGGALTTASRDGIAVVPRRGDELRPNGRARRALETDMVIIIIRVIRSTSAGCAGLQGSRVSSLLGTPGGCPEYIGLARRLARTGCLCSLHCGAVRGRRKKGHFCPRRSMPPGSGLPTFMWTSRCTPCR